MSPVLWLRADAIDATHGSAIALWEDLSGEDYDAVQATSAHRPTFDANGINGLGSVRFSENCGINAPLSSCQRQFLTVPGLGAEFASEAATVFVVAEVDDDAYAIYGTGESTTPSVCGATYCEQWWRFQGNGHGYVGAFHRSRTTQFPMNTPSSGVHLFVLRSGSTYEFTIDGSGPTPVTADFATGLTHTIGSGDIPSDGSTQAQRHFNGWVGEIIVFNDAITDEQVAMVTDYLNYKWGLGSGAPPAPVLWLRGDDISASDGSAIATWPDLSGNGYDATQSTSIHRPTFEATGIGGLGSVRFEEDCAVNEPLSGCQRQFMTIGGIGSEFGDEATMLLVAQIDDDAYAIYSTGESTAPGVCGASFCDQWWRFQGNGDGYVGAFHRSRVSQWPLNTPATGAHLFVLRSDSIYEFLIDGSGPTPVVADFATGLNHSLGSGDPPSDGSSQSQRFFNGLIGEVIVYDRALTNAELAERVSYLTNKWSL